MPKLLKFDVVHPKSYLEKKKNEWDDLDKLSTKGYRERLISLRSNYSDFYTYHLNRLGWEAEEFFLNDDLYLKKMAKELFGVKYLYERISSELWHKVRPFQWGWKQRVVKAYIKQFKPDVIFARSQPMPSNFWQQFRNHSLLVARLSARLPRRWHPEDWDMVYVDLEKFKSFFEAHDVPTFINRQGFDSRILSELEVQFPRHDVVFIGGIGTKNFSRRTQFLENVAGKTDFKWWGYWFGDKDLSNLKDFPNLKQSFQGFASGLDMFQIYKDSKIVLNDYVDTSKNIGFNQRMFEVMGVGGFMLTRQARNFKSRFPDNIFATFTGVSDCLDTINYYLKHPEERKKIGEKAQHFVIENYQYKDILSEFDRELKQQLGSKGYA